MTTNPDDDYSRTLAVLPGSAAGSTLVVETAASTTRIGGADGDAPSDPTIPVTWRIDLPGLP